MEEITILIGIIFILIFIVLSLCYYNANLKDDISYLNKRLEHEMQYHKDTVKIYEEYIENFEKTLDLLKESRQDSIEFNKSVYDFSMRTSEEYRKLLNLVKSSVEHIKDDKQIWFQNRIIKLFNSKKVNLNNIKNGQENLPH
jgi:hypothetical protein